MELSEKLKNLSPEQLELLQKKMRAKQKAAPPKDIISKREDQSSFPMSAAQMRLWFLDQLDSDSAFYNVPSAVTIKGPMNIEAMESAINHVVGRHEALRSYFVIDDSGMPQQHVHDKLSISLNVVDVSGPDEKNVDQDIAAQLEKLASTSFDLSDAPLMRVYLFAKSTTEHVLLLNMHHIIVDGWSIGIILQEIMTLYFAESKGIPSPLPEPKLQFADFAEWQNKRAEESDLDKQLKHWTDYLHGMPPVLEVITDSPRQSVTSHNGDHFKFEIDAATTAALRKLSRGHSVSMYNTLMAATQLFFHKYTQQDDFGVGAPIANRHRKELESIVGFFVNTIVLRAQFDQNISFMDVVTRVKNDVLEATENQDIPFEKIVEAVQPQRELSHSPLFQVMFDLQTSPLKAVAMDDISMDIYDIEMNAAKFDLLFLLMDQDDTIHVTIEYNSDLFKRSTIQRIADYYKTLLRHVAENPAKTVMDYSLLTREQEHTILVEWNKKSTDYPRDKAVHTLFEENVAQYPDNIAVKYDDDILSYQHMNEKANQLARYLINLGVVQGSHVAIYMERSVDMMSSIMAVLKVGAVYVPIDLAYPKARVEFMLMDAQATVVLTQSTLVDDIPAGDFNKVAVDSIKDDLEKENATNLKLSVDAGDAAYIIYTSGSTGIPKGVVVPHRAITRLVVNTDYVDITPADKITQVANVTFDAATFEIWGAFLNGATLVGISKDVLLSTQQFVERLRAEQITMMVLTTAYFNQVAKIPGAFRTLKVVMYGGEAADAESVRFVMDHQPPQFLINVYGPTENTTYSTVYTSHKDDEWGHNVPIGKPIANSTCYILDKYLQICPVGVPGELYVGGDGLAIEYYNRPELNAERFLKNPFVGGDERLYKTGDLVRYLPDGTLEFLDRIDQQVKIRGFRIELGEIESLINQNSDIQDAVVVARDNKVGDKQVVSYVVPKAGTEFDAARLKTKLLEKLPDYMVPTFFVTVDSIPLTPNGKVDKRALPDPTTSLESRTVEFVKARNALEEFLVSIWQDILGIDKIGIRDNFFELGGNSLKAAVLMNRLQKELGESAHVAAVFKAPTIGEFSMYIAEYYTEQVRKQFGAKVLKDYSFEIAVDESISDPTVDEKKLQAFRDLITPLPPQDETVRSLPKNKKAVFLLSPPRSGSTLLRVMLAGNSNLFSPPELDLLTFDTLQDRKEAFSEEGLEIWLQATIRALMELKSCEADEATRLMAEYEDQHLSTKEFYGELQKLLGDRLLVDKTPTYPFDPEILKRAEDDFEDAHYIHLVRHPYAMIYSFIEAKLDQNFFRYEHNFTRRELAELIWIISNQNILSFLENVPQERQMRVRFEDVLLNPQIELEQICQFLDIKFDPAMMEPYKGKKMTDGVQKNVQMVGDFKFYLHKNINTSVADKWKTYHKQDFLSETGWSLAETFGYPVEKELARQLHEAEKMTQIDHVARDKEIKLSFAQQRLWFLDQFDQGNIQYNVPVSVHIKGKIEVDRFQNVLNKIIERHETLRTTFETLADGRARQIIHPVIKIDLPLVDLSDYAENREELARQIADAEAAKPFDLRYGPLIRAKIIRLAPDEHVLIIVTHHIISDGWSVNVIIREFAEIREALYHNQSIALPPLTIQYADFAAWQRQWLSGERLENELSYWKNQLASPPPALELPTDRPRSAASSHRGKDVIFNLSSELSDAIAEVTQKHGVTTFMTLLSAFQVLLARYANQTDILVGTPIANRTRKEVEPLIGFFVNTLVMRSDLSDNPSFSTLLERVKKTSLEAYDNQNIPFEKLVDALQPERDTQHTPFFQAMFAMQESALESIELSELTLSVFQISSGAAKFDLSLSMVERFGTLRGQLEYDADLFDAATIERMIGHFQNLLIGLTQSPQTPVGQIPFVGFDERQRLLTICNDFSKDFSDSRCIHHLVEEQVAAHKNSVAVSYEDVVLTYGELDEKANKLANFLTRHGVRPDDLVGLCLDRSLDMVVGILGILKSGAGYVPIDPMYPSDRKDFILQDSGMKLLLTQESVSQELIDVQTPKVCLDSEWATIDAESGNSPNVPVSPDNVAYVIYTSGSTGKPKGVMVCHENVTRLLHATNAWYHFNEQDVWSLFHSFAFDFSVWELWGGLFYGGHVAIVPYMVSRSPEQFYQLLVDKGVTVLNQTPSAFRQLLQQEEINGASPDLKLRYVIFGGDKLELGSLKPWFEIHGYAKPQLINMYGITETTVHVTYRPLEQVDIESTSGSMIGGPIPDLQIYILDENFEPMPVGLPGELYVGGAGLARGYLKRPELTAQKFIPNPFDQKPGSRLYKTGDLARFLENGDIEYLGRIDHQVQLRGFRVELGEIEAVLSEHPDIKETLVLLREDKPGDQKLVAYYVVPDEDVSITVSELHVLLKEKLPDYMVPANFVRMTGFPLTAHGKIDRRSLPLPEAIRPEFEHDYADAETHSEQVLVDIWKQVLGLEVIGIDDNFFELGGDSILSIQVVARAHQAGFKLSAKQIFDTPTIRGLAANAQTGVKVEAEQGVVTGDVPLTPIQHWFFEQNFENINHWNQSVVLDVLEKIDPQHLIKVFAKISEHHDVLRLRFKNENIWTSFLAPNEAAIPLHTFDLSHVADEDIDRSLENLTADIQAGLDLINGPMMQCAFFDLGEHRLDKLFICIHHMAIDGLSWRILLEDIMRAYNAVANGKDIQLPQKSTSIKEWSEKLVEYAGTDLSDKADVWVSDAVQQTLPVDFDGADTEASTQIISVELSISDTLALLQDVPAAYKSQINDVLLTALVMAFEKWTGDPQLRIDLEGHGREDVLEKVDISRTMGWFTTIYPVLLDVRDQSTIQDKVKAVKSQLHAIPNNGFDYGVLRYLNINDVSTALSKNPEPQVAFNYLGQFSQMANNPSFQLSDFQSNAERDLKNRRVHQIFISGKVAQDKLQMSFFYSENVYKADTMSAFAENYISSLQEIISVAKNSDGSSETEHVENQILQDENLDDVLSELGLE